MASNHGWLSFKFSDGTPVQLVDATPESAIYQVAGQDTYIIIDAATPGDISESGLSLEEARKVVGKDK